MIKQYKLAGFINLFDITPDFIYPVFKRAGKYYFQHSTDGSIQEFVAVKKAALAKMLPVEKLMNICVHEQAGLLYAYQVDDKSIVYGNSAYMKSYIEEKALFSEAYQSDHILKEEIDDFLDEAESELKNALSTESVGDTVLIKSNAHHGILSHLSEKPVWRRSLSAVAISLSVCLCFFVLNRITNFAIFPNPPVPTAPPSIISWSDINTTSIQLANRDYSQFFQLSLSEEQFNSLGDVGFEVFRKDGEAYALISDTHVDINQEEAFTLSSEYNHQAVYILDANGNPISPALPYSENKDGLYNIEAKLSAHVEGGNAISQVHALLVCKKAGKTDELTIQSAYEWDEQLQQYNPQRVVSISDYDTIEITQQFRTALMDTNGTLLSWKEWPIVKENTYTCSLKEGQKLSLMTSQLDLSELYASFAIRDLQNQSVLSSLLQMEEAPGEMDILVQYDNHNYILLNSPTCTVVDNKAAKLFILSMKVKNITDHEVVIKTENVVVNQKATELSSIVYGNGPNWGLLNSEEQSLTLSVPDGIIDPEAITVIKLTLVIQYMDNDTVQEIPVEITVHKTT